MNCSQAAERNSQYYNGSLIRINQRIQIRPKCSPNFFFQWSGHQGFIFNPKEASQFLVRSPLT
jgi:hypothetical protein